MNKIKTLFVLLMVFWAVPNMLFAADDYPDHHWQPENTDFNMTAVFAIRIDDVMQTSVDLELGAFAGEVCRSSFHLVPPPFNTGVYITEGYNIQGLAGETITFRLYDHGTQSELDVMTAYSIPFVPNQNIGNAVSPQFIDFYTVTPHYYMLITDESQLVEGRRYLIADGYDGTVMAMSGYDEEEEMRFAVGMTCEHHKTNQAPAVVPAMGYVYQFTLGSLDEQWSIYDEANEAYLVADENGSMELSEDPLEWSVTVSPDGKAQIKATVSNVEQYLHYDSEEERFLCDGDNGSQVYLFALCDLVSGTVASLSVTEPAGMYVVESGDTLTVTDLSTVHVSNLIIEDGAQLINASEGVLATMQKSVEAYTDVAVSDGWYTIASPMVAAPVEEGSNLVFPHYDLYAFDETCLTEEEWRNYKNNANNGFTGFEAGRGYLYANSNTFTPVFKGVLNHKDVAFPLTYTDARTDQLKGFNLIGNPFPHSIYKGAGGAIDDSDLASGYYVLTNEGSWMARTYETAIEPGQGVLVQTAVAKDLDFAKSTAAATAETSSQKSRGNAVPRIAVYLSDGSVADAAYVYLSEGRSLEKIAHFNPNNPALSVCWNGDNLAIAHVDEDAESVDLRFDYHKTGTYTISVEAKDWTTNYLHLIDHLTGADIDLLRQPSYAVKVTGQEYASRFKLVLQGGDGSDEPYAYFNGSEWMLTGHHDGTTLQVIDVSGRVLDFGVVKHHFSTQGLAPGVYVFRFIHGDTTSSQKVIIK